MEWSKIIWVIWALSFKVIWGWDKIGYYHEFTVMHSTDVKEPAYINLLPLLKTWLAGKEKKNFGWGDSRFEGDYGTKSGEFFTASTTSTDKMFKNIMDNLGGYLQFKTQFRKDVLLYLAKLHEVLLSGKGQWDFVFYTNEISSDQSGAVTQ